MTDDQAGPAGDDAPTAALAAFATTIRVGLGGSAQETHSATGGYEWRWTQRGGWVLLAGGILDPRPLLEGPAGFWRLAAATPAAADLLLLMVQLGGGLPDGAPEHQRGVVTVGRRVPADPALSGNPARAFRINPGTPQRQALSPAVPGTVYGHLPVGIMSTGDAAQVASAVVDAARAAGSDLPPRGAGVTEPPAESVGPPA